MFMGSTLITLSFNFNEKSIGLEPVKVLGLPLLVLFKLLSLGRLRLLESLPLHMDTLGVSVDMGGDGGGVGSLLPTVLKAEDEIILCCCGWFRLK